MPVTAPGSGSPEPTLADVQRDYPAWNCAQGISGFYYARHLASGTQVSGEDPLDLRDQIKASEARLACLQQPAESATSGS
jgi:hypothetical protein